MKNIKLIQKALEYYGDKKADAEGYSAGEKFWDLANKLEDAENIINNAIGFIASIMENVDCDIEIEEGFTILDGWKTFVEPLEKMFD